MLMKGGHDALHNTGSLSLTHKEYRMTANTCPYCNNPANNTSWCCESLKQAYKSMTQGVKRVSNTGSTLLGFGLPVSKAHVDESELSPFDEGFKIPVSKEARESYTRAVKALSSNKSLFLWGGQANGKDAVIQMVSRLCNRPLLWLTLSENTDLEGLLFTRGFDENGTTYEYGKLWRALTEGYLSPTGERVPYVICFSDMDRLAPTQAEVFRSIMDTTKGRINAPDGSVLPIFEGTLICATANSNGSGGGGRYNVSAIDSSLMDRFARAVKAELPSARERVEIASARLGLTFESHPWLSEVENALSAVDRAIVQEEIEAEDGFSYRALGAWLESMIEWQSATGERHALTALRDVTDKLDTEVAEKVEALCKPHLSA